MVDYKSLIVIGIAGLVIGYCLIWGSPKPYQAHSQPVPEPAARIFETGPAFTPQEWVALTPAQRVQIAQQLRGRIMASQAVTGKGVRP